MGDEEHDGRRRVVIAALRPSVGEGRGAVKRTLGELVAVEPPGDGRGLAGDLEAHRHGPAADPAANSRLNPRFEAEESLASPQR